MPHLTKIATCCYCGTRAALVLKGHERHELACSGCGAPLRELKAMPVLQQQIPDNRAVGRPCSRRPKAAKKKKKAKRKNGLRYFAREAFDFLEDVFD